MSDNAKIEFTKMRLRRMTRERDDFCLRLFEEKITVKNLKMQMETLRDELNRLRRLVPTGSYTLNVAHEEELERMREALRAAEKRELEALAELDEERAEAERWRNAHHEASIRLQAHDCGEEAAKLYERAGRAEEAVTKLGEQLNASEADCERFGKLLDDCRNVLLGQYDPDSVNAMIHRIDDAIGPWESVAP